MSQLFVKNWLNKGAMPALRLGMQFTQARHPLIANNIANADTPYYQAQDLDENKFQQQLRRSLDRRAQGNPRLFKFESTFGMETGPEGQLAPLTVASKNVGIQKHDQNNVSIDKEMVRLSENSMKFNLYTQLLAKEYGQIQSAIRGRAV